MASYQKYQTKNGLRWRTTISYTDHRGKYKQVTRGGFKFKKEAVQVANQLEADLKQNRYLAESKLTFEQVYKKWLRIKSDLKPSSQQNIKSVVKNHLTPIFGDMIVSKISIDDCQNAVEEWYSHPYKKYYRFFLLLHSILDFAVERNYIMFNPADKVHVPRADHQKVKEQHKKQFYTREELQEVLKAIKADGSTEMFTFFWLLANTGLRRGEMIALRWSDIDFENSTLTVNRTQTYGLNNKSITNSPKTKKSKRTVYLAGITIDYLKKWQLEQAKLMLIMGKNANNSNLQIFTRISDFRMMSANYPRTYLKRVCEAYNVPYVEIKGWRHTYATLGIEDHHLTTKQVQEQLGHATANMTLNVYAGVTSDEKVKTADTMASLIDWH